MSAPEKESLKAQTSDQRSRRRRAQSPLGLLADAPLEQLNAIVEDFKAFLEQEAEKFQLKKRQPSSAHQSDTKEPSNVGSVKAQSHSDSEA